MCHFAGGRVGMFGVPFCWGQGGDVWCAILLGTGWGCLVCHFAGGRVGRFGVPFCWGRVGMFGVPFCWGQGG